MEAKSFVSIFDLNNVKMQKILSFFSVKKKRKKTKVSEVSHMSKFADL